MYKNLIFDLDDTILKCGIYYSQCKQRFIQFSHLRTGIKKELIEKILDDLDLTCTSLPNGFGKERFPRSFAAASSALDVIIGHPVDVLAAEQSYMIGNTVFAAEYEPYDNAIETLESYKNAGFNLFLCTKGDIDVQMNKIKSHGLQKLFDSDKIYIIQKKTPLVLTEIMFNHNLVETETVMIGDSIRDDVGSAIGAGIDSVWISNTSKPKWSYENSDHVPTNSVLSLELLPTVIPIQK